MGRMDDEERAVMAALQAIVDTPWADPEDRGAEATIIMGWAPVELRPVSWSLVQVDHALQRLEAKGKVVGTDRDLFTTLWRLA